MTGSYRLFGSEMSPYSIKVRSYFRYKNIPHEWIARSPATESAYKKYARLPIVPTVVTPQDEAMQDSTPIIEALDARYPSPSIHPDNELHFLSALIEEFGDEWGNKLMFHFRWWDEIDQRASAQTLARLMQPHGAKDDIANLAKMILARMTTRGHFVGSSADTAPLIEAYFDELLALLDPHLATRPYLFGARPAFADFGLAAQLYECAVDPTCGSILRARSPHILDWSLRMLEPRDDGPFETWQSLEPTLAPLLEYIGRTFLPWTVANAQALAAGQDSFTVTIAGEPYTQTPQKYHAKSLAVLREKYRAASSDPRLVQILSQTGCARHL
ncbi:MAG TPA: glutathione S-transferase family protein [Rhizomicrobium sp.]|nr:glutathione S-transferase family protein [Rhizomicrobium sp.]